MKLLDEGCRVYSPTDGQVATLGTWTARTVICQATGAKQITQTVSEYTPEGLVGQAYSPVLPGFMNPLAEEVLYVASGEGLCRIRGDHYALRRGAAVFVPPGAVCQIENTGSETLRIVSSCCPEDPGRRITEPIQSAETSLVRRDGAADTSVRATLTVHEDDREVIRAGADRMFRFLVHTDLGCRNVTQFVGWIPPSRAPFHFHTYEECIFILEGQGILHLE